MNREAIANALLALLNTAQISSQPIFKTSTRRVDVWANSSPADKPALYLAEPLESYARPYQKATPQIVTLTYQVFIYADAVDPNIVPQTQLNQILDAIDTAMTPRPLPGQETFITLGNLVSAAWIEGEVLKAPGYLQGTSAILIPIKVTVPT